MPCRTPTSSRPPHALAPAPPSWHCAGHAPPHPCSRLRRTGSRSSDGSIRSPPSRAPATHGRAIIASAAIRGGLLGTGIGVGAAAACLALHYHVKAPMAAGAVGASTRVVMDILLATVARQPSMGAALFNQAGPCAPLPAPWGSPSGACAGDGTGLRVRPGPRPLHHHGGRRERRAALPAADRAVALLPPPDVTRLVVRKTVQVLGTGPGTSLADLPARAIGEHPVVQDQRPAGGFPRLIAPWPRDGDGLGTLHAADRRRPDACLHDAAHGWRKRFLDATGCCLGQGPLPPFGRPLRDRLAPLQREDRWQR